MGWLLILPATRWKLLFVPFSKTKTKKIELFYILFLNFNFSKKQGVTENEILYILLVPNRVDIHLPH